MTNPSEEGDLCIPGSEPIIAEGVRGIWFDLPDAIYVTFLYGYPSGHGHVGRMIDELPHDRRIIFPVVLSQILSGMLKRRGYLQMRLRDPRDGSAYSAMVREPRASKSRYFVISGASTDHDLIEKVERHGRYLHGNFYGCLAGSEVFGSSEIQVTRTTCVAVCPWCDSSRCKLLNGHEGKHDHGLCETLVARGSSRAAQW